MATRRRFSTEYKQQAVELARTGNKSVSQVARDLGIDPNMLSRWCREVEATSPQKAFPGQGKTRDEELAALRRELAQVKKERDFLKEAAVFFAKDSK
jgi:transposase